MQSQLTSWCHDDTYKNELDQLVTAAKDLFGSARLQLTTLGDIGQSLQSLMNLTYNSDLHGKLYLGTSDSNNSVILPQSCSEVVSAYLNQPRQDGGLQTDYDQPHGSSGFDYYGEFDEIINDDENYVSYDQDKSTQDYSLNVGTADLHPAPDIDVY